MFFYAHRVFAVGELEKAVSALLRKLELKDFSINVTDVLPDGTHLKRKVSLEELEAVCDPARETVYVYVHGEKDVAIILEGSADGNYRLYISVATGQLLNSIREHLEQALSLESPPEPPKEADPVAVSIDKLVTEIIGPLRSRLESLEQKVLLGSRRLRCFLSFRFTNANELLALRVQQFLAALDVEVLTGASYEPRQVSDKVLSKLREPLDFVVILITSDGESMWTRDEIGTAIHKGIALVPIVQKGAHLEPGLFADVEYIEFECEHIGDAFLKLLQAVRFVREQKTTASASGQVNTPAVN